MLEGPRWRLVGILALLGLGVAALIELLAHQAAGYTPVFGRYTWKYLLMMAGYLLGLATLSARLIWLSISKRELRPVSAQVTIVFLIVYAAACAGVWVLLPRFAASVILSSNLLLRPALTLMLSLGLLSLPQADARLWRQVVGVSAGLGMLGALVGFGALYYHHEFLCAVHVWEPEYRVDDWPQWRADSTHSGYLSGRGEISAPTVAWSYFLGGMPGSVFVVHEDDDALVVLAGGGQLAAFSETGDTRWTTETFAEPSILGAWDLSGEGILDLVVLNSDRRRGALQIISTRDGEEIYRTEYLGGRVGAVMVADLTGDAIPELIWGPAAVSEIYAYTLVDTPEMLWATTLEDYVSDPYTHSSIAVGDVNADGQPEVIVAGARGQTVVIVLSRTGEELGRVNFGAGVEAGGDRHLVWIGPLDDHPGDDILIVGGWAIKTYMFQGIARLHVVGNTPVVDVEINMAPHGPRYVRHSLNDMDGDGAYEVLFTRYNPDEGGDEIVILDVITGDMEARIPGASLLGIIPPTGDEPTPTLVTQTSNNVVQALSIGADMEPITLWDLSDRDVAVEERAVILPPSVMYYNPDLHTLDTDGDGIEEILTVTETAGQEWQIDTFNVRNGAHVTQSTIQSLSQPSILWSDEGGLIVASPDAQVFSLDAQLGVLSTMEFGGFYYRPYLPWVEREVAAVADIDGDGTASVLAMNAPGHVLSVDGQGSSMPISDVDERVSEFLSADLDGDGAWEIITSTECAITVRAGDGEMVWERHFEGCSGEPRGSSVGDLNADGTLDIATFVPIPFRNYAPLTALDGRNGHILWDTSSFPREYQGYTTSVATLGPINNDPYADTIFSSNELEGAALQGHNGHILVAPGILPPYLYLGRVDYGGAIILLDADDDPSPEVLNALDTAHLALFELPSDYCATTEPVGRNPLRVAWSVSQVFLDDEVFSAPAVVPVADMYGSVIIGLGSARGIFRARNAATGDLLWEVGLLEGQAVPGASEVPNALGSTAAADIDGDGAVEFVVGGTDGWLYTLRATDGMLVWAYELGYPLGDPILGDVDGDGLLEIVVPAADGYLYALDG